MPEDDDAEQCAAENVTEADEKQKHMMEENLRMPKRDRNTEQAIPERDLHCAENAERDEIRETVAVAARRDFRRPA